MFEITKTCTKKKKKNRKIYLKIIIAMGFVPGIEVSFVFESLKNLSKNLKWQFVFRFVFAHSNFSNGKHWLPYVHARVDVVGDVDVRLDGLPDVYLDRSADVHFQSARHFHVQRVGDPESCAPDGQHAQLPEASPGRGTDAHAFLRDFAPA